MNCGRRICRSSVNDITALDMQKEYLTHLELMPMHGSIADTDSEAQLDKMGDTINAMLESLSNVSSSKGSVPTQSITLRLRHNGVLPSSVVLCRCC